MNAGNGRSLKLSRRSNYFGTVDGGDNRQSLAAIGYRSIVFFSSPADWPFNSISVWHNEAVRPVLVANQHILSSVTDLTLAD